MKRTSQSGILDYKKDILLVGATYSENTGDGVIADCLDWAVRQTSPGLTIKHLDLAGRTKVGAKSVYGRGLILRLVDRLPSSIGQWIVSVGLQRLLRRLRPDWIRRVGEADAVIISGGQLFADTNLNFPLKIGQLADICRNSGIPLSVASAGVSQDWSQKGKKLFIELADCDLRFLGFRDQTSIANWMQQFGSRGPEPVLVRDPGLLAKECYGIPASTEEKPPIGIGIASAIILAHHSDEVIAGAGRHSSQAALFDFFRSSTLALNAQGHGVCLFCNGATEDAAFLKELSLDPAIAKAESIGKVKIAPIPRTGRELAQIIAGCGLIMAHRLHACVLGYSFGRPVVGLSWDTKLRSFFASVDLSEHVITQAEVLEHDVVGAVDAALRKGVNLEARDKFIDECRAGIASVLKATLA